MKKLISLFLCVLTLVSLSLTAFAAPAPVDKSGETMSPAGANKPGAEVQATAHTHNWVWKYSYNGGYAISSSGCAAITYHKWECACGATYDSRVTEAEKPHSGGKRYSATCNGNIQTWYYTSCSRCSTSYTTTCVCPGKGHQGPCPCLPV